MQAGKTIAGKRELPQADSERRRAQKAIRRRKTLAVLGVLALFIGLLYLFFRAFQEWVKWSENKTEVIVVEKQPSADIIDEGTGKKTEATAKVREYVILLEEEMARLGYNVALVRIPTGKVREIDVELEGISGFVKMSVDRGVYGTCEDFTKMMKYLNGQTFEYLDLRVERKAYWK